MRTAITLAYHKGGELVEMVAGPLTPIDEQRAYFKQAKQSKVHPQFERIEYWESGAGCVLHHNYREGIWVVQPPAPAQDPKPPEVPAAVQPPAPEPEAPTQAPEADEAEEAAEFETGKPSDAKPKKRR